MAEETYLEKCNFRNFRSFITLTLDRVIRNTVVHHSSTYIYTPHFIEIGKTFCGWMDGYTYGRTYWRMDTYPLMLLGRLLRVDLNIQNAKSKETHKLNLNQHSTLRNVHVCAYHCAQLSYTTQHRTVLIILPLILQTTITAQMLSIGREEPLFSRV